MLLLLTGLAIATVPSAWITASPFGICAHLPDDVILDRIAEAGIAWIRIDVRWSLVQPEPDVWDWTAIDRVVDGARARGLEIYATLSDTPAWATDDDPGNGPPRDPADWARFCYRAVARYRGRIRAWGLWNEPNLDRFWTGSRTGYIETIVLPGADAIHAADPFALACAPDTAHLHSARWDRWLHDVAVAGRYRLDVVTHHVYPSNGSHRTVSSALDRPPANPWDDPSVRQVLQDAGWFGRPFWLTETGMASDLWGETDQAGLYSNLLEDWFRPGTDLNWIGRIFFYEAADDPGASHAWGIMGPPPEYEPKPAYSAYADFIAGAEVADADLVSASGRTFLHPGEKATARVEFRNTGTVPWNAADGYRLEAVEDPVGLVRSGLDLPAGSSILPGETAVFELELTAPGLATGGSILVLRMAGPAEKRFGAALRATITVSRDDPPSILRQPVSRTVPRGAPVRLELEAWSPASLSYRWQRDGADLREGNQFHGTASSALTVFSAGPHTEGEYRCLVTNAAGTVATTTVTVRTGPAPPPRQPSGRIPRRHRR